MPKITIQFLCTQTYILIYIGNSNSYGRKGVLSAPIFMDNVACYGSEDKLIECSYHTDTTEDTVMSDNVTSMVALVTPIALGISILVIVLLIGCLVYKHKRNSRTDHR